MGDFNALILARRQADVPQVKAEFQAALREAEKHLPDPKHYKTLIAGADDLFEGRRASSCRARRRRTRAGGCARRCSR